MNICNQLFIVKIIYILKLLFNLIKTIIPLILIVLIMIDIISAMISNPDKISVAITKSIKRFIAAIVIFLAPTIIGVLFNTLNIINNNDFLCFNAATKEKIVALEITRKAEIDKTRVLEAEDTKKEQSNNNTSSKSNNNSNNTNNNNNNSKSASKPSKYSASNPPVVSAGAALTTFVNDEPRAVGKGECLSWDDNCYCPSSGNLIGFKFILTDPDSTSMIIDGGPKLVSVSTPCGKSVYVNEKYASNFSKALNSMCGLTGVDNSVTVKNPVTKVVREVTEINKNNNTNKSVIKKNNIITTKEISMNYSDIILAANNTKKIEIGHYAVVSRKLFSNRSMCSLHAYGVAIDINNLYSVTVNGKTYRPYANQGINYYYVYNNLVEAIGSVDDYRNPNYILWQKAFKPAGFTWGGNWSNSAFDPMHFEIR